MCTVNDSQYFLSIVQYVNLSVIVCISFVDISWMKCINKERKHVSLSPKIIKFINFWSWLAIVFFCLHQQTLQPALDYDFFKSALENKRGHINIVHRYLCAHIHSQFQIGFDLHCTSMSFPLRRMQDFLGAAVNTGLEKPTFNRRYIFGPSFCVIRPFPVYKALALLKASACY